MRFAFSRVILVLCAACVLHACGRSYLAARIPEPPDQTQAYERVSAGETSTDGERVHNWTCRKEGFISSPFLTDGLRECTDLNSTTESNVLSFRIYGRPDYLLFLGGNAKAFGRAAEFRPGDIIQFSGIIHNIAPVQQMHMGTKIAVQVTALQLLSATGQIMQDQARIRRAESSIPNVQASSQRTSDLSASRTEVPPPTEAQIATPSTKPAVELGSNAPIADADVTTAPNGHAYAFVSAPNVSWERAERNAEARTFNGVPGHLATIENEREYEFIVNTVFANNTTGTTLLGGKQTAPGEWRWVTGRAATADQGNGELFYEGYENGKVVGEHFARWMQSAFQRGGAWDVSNVQYVSLFSYHKPLLSTAIWRRPPGGGRCWLSGRI